MNPQWRLILDGKGDGYYNMAVDEAILFNYQHLKTPTLRIYGWQEPFISLGYNQNVSDVFIGQRSIPFVRRMTGGSAILHHKEVTYSITCSPPDLNLPHQVKKSYEILCSFIKDFYKQLGLNVQFAKDLFSSGLGRYKNFCFSSLEHFDFIINGKKIGGNAQRRRKNLVFQHGSIPQALNFETIERLIKDTSNPKIEAASLDCLLGKPTDFYHLGKALADSFSKVFGITFTEEKLSLEELQAVDSFLEYKYKNKEWNYFKKAKIIAIYEKCKTSLVE